MPGDLLGDYISVGSRRHFSNKKPTEFNNGFRLAAVKLMGVGVFLVLFAGLIQLQILAGPYYRNLADGNRIREVPIHAPRGIIYDRNDLPLTANLASFRLNNQGISKEQAIILESKGQLLEIDSNRSYLKGAPLAHILGYVSESYDSNGQKVGHGGVEEFYEERLKGKDGKELVEVDAVGQKLRTISTISPVPGQNLVLTIDAALQKTAYEALNGRKGSVVVSKPISGEILALVSSPSYDPNIFTDLSILPDERNERINKLFSDPALPMFNRAIGGTFPPGSTYKLVTSTAGLETGAIKGTTKFEDTGVLIVGPYKFPNWKWLKSGGVDGWIDVVDALKNSNDVFFYKTGEAIGIDNLIAWSKKMGLGHTLGVDLPGEVGGLVDKTREWYLGDTYHYAIGQGDLLVTPLQGNTWTNIIANGGHLCTPYLFQKGQCKDLGIKPETIDLVKKGMVRACMPGGTGYPLFDYKPQVACKTGTAEFGSDNKTHAWFTSFAPVDKPEISVTVLVEGAGEGSDVAAPIARKIYEEWFGKN